MRACISIGYFSTPTSVPSSRPFVLTLSAPSSSFLDNRNDLRYEGMKTQSTSSKSWHDANVYPPSFLPPKWGGLPSLCISRTLTLITTAFGVSRGAMSKHGVADNRNKWIKHAIPTAIQPLMEDCRWENVTQ